MKKLSATERSILGFMQFQARTSYSEVARSLGVHLNTVQRVVDRLTERGYVTPCMRLNLRGMGLYSFGLWASLSDIGVKKEGELVSLLKAHPQVYSVFSLCGEFDLLIEMYVTDPKEVESLLSSIAAMAGNAFCQTAVVHHLYWYTFEKTHIVNGNNSAGRRQILYHYNSPPNLDSLDVKLIEGLSTCPLVSQRELARTLDVPVQTLNVRFHRLVEHRIILGTEFVYNYGSSDVVGYRLLIQVEAVTPQLETNLLTYCHSVGNIVGFGRHYGEWDFELYIEIARLQELDEVMRKIKRVLGGVIRRSSLQVMSAVLKQEHRVWSFSRQKNRLPQ
jgi:DNA-binding Lrp family transcriptional regulator